MLRHSAGSGKGAFVVVNAGAGLLNAVAVVHHDAGGPIQNVVGEARVVGGYGVPEQRTRRERAVIVLVEISRQLVAVVGHDRERLLVAVKSCCISPDLADRQRDSSTGAIGNGAVVAGINVHKLR